MGDGIQTRYATYKDQVQITLQHFLIVHVGPIIV